MLNIPNNIIELYKQENIPKSLELFFPDINLTITNNQIVSESFSLTERLCSSKDLLFGSCEASEVKVTVADVSHEIKGQKLIVTQIIGGYRVPLGAYYVDSAKKQNNLRFKDVIAYDGMVKFDEDVSSWYNSLSYPISIKQMRSSLCAYVGVTEEDKTLVNDDVVVYKTMEASQIKGRHILVCIEEINGVFGHFDRSGTLRHIALNKDYGLYPHETLYPFETMHPEYGTEVIEKAFYREVKFEEYAVKPIDKLQIRQEENDIGVIIGNGTNNYAIEGNFLVFGKSSEELREIAERVSQNILGISYRPYKSVCTGLPYLEVGDSIAFNTNDTVVSYVFERTLKGIQALKDDCIANGSENRPQSFDLNIEIRQLQGKALIIKKEIEELSNTVIDLQEETQSQFTQTAQTIELKVDKAGVISAINLSSEGVSINASKINLTGYATFYSLFAQGESVINGSNIRTGTLDASIVNVINLNADNITAGNISGNRINGGTIQGVEILSVSPLGVIEIDGPYIMGWNSFGQNRLNIDYNGNATFSSVSCSTINSYTPVTSGNLSSYLSTQYVYGIKNPSGFYNAYVSINENIIPSSSGGMGIGSSPNRFNNGYFNNVYNSAGIITSSDRRIKNHIKPLDIRYLELAKKLKPCIFRYENGTSGRYHPGFIAQEVEEVMNECEISDIEFSGLIRNPVYSKMIDGDYDLTSEIIDYEYALRKEDFIPLLFLWLADIEERLGA